jgi:osmoprotectant transport system ATP-binding protein
VGLFPHMDVATNVGLVPKMLGWDRKRIDARVDELLHLVGLEPGQFRHRLPWQLSGGQQQRIGVARALAADPPVMLMDEPFSAVDPIVRGSLQDEFLRLQSELRKTIVFVTHDIDEAIKLGHRIAVFEVGGTLAQYASPEELLAAPKEGFVTDFLGGERGLKRLRFFQELDAEEASVPVEAGDAPVGGQ